MHQNTDAIYVNELFSHTDQTVKNKHMTSNESFKKNSKNKTTERYAKGLAIYSNCQ